MTKLLLFLLVMTFGVFVQSTVGFGGPLIIMPLGLMLLPLGVVKPVTTFTIISTSTGVSWPKWPA